METAAELILLVVLLGFSQANYSQSVIKAMLVASLATD